MSEVLEPDSRLSRRSLFARSAASGASIALVGSVPGLFGTAAAAAASGRGKPGPAGYGPLIQDPKGILSLPKDFSYKVIAKSGSTKLDSGQPTPGLLDSRRGSPPFAGCRRSRLFSRCSCKYHRECSAQLHKRQCSAGRAFS